MSKLPTQEEQPLNEAARLYAINHSNAPDKETPDWIITDFKAGAMWMAQQLSSTSGKIEANRNGFYCQCEIETDVPCEQQCEHCKEYYKPLEQDKEAVAEKDLVGKDLDTSKKDGLTILNEIVESMIQNGGDDDLHAVQYHIDQIKKSQEEKDLLASDNNNGDIE